MQKWLPKLVAKFWLPNLILYQTVYGVCLLTSNYSCVPREISALWWPNIWPKMAFPERFEQTIDSIWSNDNDSTGFWPPGSLHTLGADGHI